MELNPATGRLSLSAPGKTKRKEPWDPPDQPNPTSLNQLLYFTFLKHTQKFWLACFKISPMQHQNKNTVQEESHGGQQRRFQENTKHKTHDHYVGRLRKTELYLGCPSVSGKPYPHGSRATGGPLLLSLDKAPCCSDSRCCHYQAVLLRHAWKASGKLSQGGTSWVLLLGAKQTGPLVTVCSFAGVPRGAAHNLFQA